MQGSTFQLLIQSTRDQILNYIAIIVKRVVNGIKKTAFVCCWPSRRTIIKPFDPFHFFFSLLCLAAHYAQHKILFDPHSHCFNISISTTIHSGVALVMFQYLRFHSNFNKNFTKWRILFQATDTFPGVFDIFSYLSKSCYVFWWC